MPEPILFYFNPTCELAIANGSFSYMPPSLLQQMERELAMLPFVFGTENDYVLIENPPSENFIRKLKSAGFTVPKFLTVNDLENLPAPGIESIHPWGWSPAAHYKLRKLKERCGEEFKRSPVFNWTPEHKSLFERATSLNLLGKILENHPPEFFIDKSLTGIKITQTEEIEPLLKKHSALVIKAPLSSSGRGVQFIRREILSQSNRQWISGVLKQQNYLIAEPLLEKVMDISFHFQITPDSSLNYLGYSVFETSSNGQYKASLIRPDLKKILPWTDVGLLEEMLTTAAEFVLETLTNSGYHRLHRGFLGVDALVFRHQDKLKIQPCIEVNSRMNMGVLSMFCEKQIHPESSGKFELYYGKAGDYCNFAAVQEARNQPRLQDGKNFSGFYSLTEPSDNQRFGAYISLAGER